MDVKVKEHQLLRDRYQKTGNGVSHETVVKWLEK